MYVLTACYCQHTKSYEIRVLNKQFDMLLINRGVANV